MKLLAFVITVMAAPNWKELSPTCSQLLQHPVSSAPLYWLALPGDPVLRERSLLVQPEFFGGAELESFSRALADELFAHPNLSGLSAPQVRVGLRVFVLRRSFVNPFNRQYDVYVNPTMTPVDEEVATWIETCISLKGIRLIRRFETVRLEYFTLNGDYKTEVFSGLRARIVQHEMDHLDGVLMSDR